MYICTLVHFIRSLKSKTLCITMPPPNRSEFPNVRQWDATSAEGSAGNSIWIRDGAGDSDGGKHSQNESNWKRWSGNVEIGCSAAVLLQMWKGSTLPRAITYTYINEYTHTYLYVYVCLRGGFCCEMLCATNYRHLVFDNSSWRKFQISTFKFVCLPPLLCYSYACSMCVRVCVLSIWLWLCSAAAAPLEIRNQADGGNFIYYITLLYLCSFWCQLSNRKSLFIFHRLKR